MEKRVKLFEQFHQDLANESKMSEIDIIGKEAETRDAFKKELKDFLKKNAADPRIADDENAIDQMADTYFDKEGNKLTEKFTPIGGFVKVSKEDDMQKDKSKPRLYFDTNVLRFVTYKTPFEVDNSKYQLTKESLHEADDKLKLTKTLGLYNTLSTQKDMSEQESKELLSETVDNATSDLIDNIMDNLKREVDELKKSVLKIKDKSNDINTKRDANKVLQSIEKTHDSLITVQEYLNALLQG